MYTSLLYHVEWLVNLYWGVGMWHHAVAGMDWALQESTVMRHVGIPILVLVLSTLCRTADSTISTVVALPLSITANSLYLAVVWVLSYCIRGRLLLGRRSLQRSSWGLIILAWTGYISLFLNQRIATLLGVLMTVGALVQAILMVATKTGSLSDTQSPVGLRAGSGAAGHATARVVAWALPSMAFWLVGDVVLIILRRQVHGHLFHVVIPLIGWMAATLSSWQGPIPNGSRLPGWLLRTSRWLVATYSSTRLLHWHVSPNSLLLLFALLLGLDRLEPRLIQQPKDHG